MDVTSPAIRYRSDEGTNSLRSFVEGNIISGSNARHEIDRVTRYHLYWNFYEGKHWRDYNDTLLKFNYCKAFVDKTAQFLLGKESFSLKVCDYGNDLVDPKIESAAEQLLMGTWKRNKKNQLSYEMLQMGGVSGDLWMGLEWDQDKKFVRYRIYDSRQCFPTFTNGDFNLLESFMVRQPLTQNPNGYTLFVTNFSKNQVSQWLQKDTALDGEQFNKQTSDNPLGFIPVVHIKNKPQAAGYYAVSDLRDIIDLNKTYNELSQELKSIIDYYATPTTVVTGATIKQLKKGLGNVWSGLPPEANVFNLGLDADISAATDFLATIKTSMHELSDVPENFLGKIQPISNTSAAALQLTYQPIMQQADQKWLSYGEGIAEMNAMTIRILRIYDKNNKFLLQLSPDFEDMYTVEPVFCYGFPRDKTVDLQNAQMELTLKLNTRRNIMNELGYDNVPALITAVKQETLEFGQIDAMVQEMLTEATAPEYPQIPAPNQGVSGGNQGSSNGQQQQPPSQNQLLNQQGPGGGVKQTKNSK